MTRRSCNADPVGNVNLRLNATLLYDTMNETDKRWLKGIVSTNRSCNADPVGNVNLMSFRVPETRGVADDNHGVWVKVRSGNVAGANTQGGDGLCFGSHQLRTHHLG